MNNSVVFAEQMVIAKEFTKENSYKELLAEKIKTYEVNQLGPEDALSLLTGIDVLKTKKYIDEYGLFELPKYINAFNITKTQQKKLQLFFHLLKQVNESKLKQKKLLSSSNSTGQFFVNYMRDFNVEKFVIALTDSQNRMIGVQTMFEGTIGEATIYIREIIKLALNNNAKNVLFAHNHPGGSTKASVADIEMTRNCKKALDLVKIELLDHFIIADNNYISMREQGVF